MKTCSCLVDVLLHISIKTMYSNTLEPVELESVLATNELKQDVTNVSFTDMSQSFDCSRIITSSYRFLPEKNPRHAIKDDCCKVGIIASDSEHAVILTPLVQALSKRAATLNPKVARITYKVYVVEKMEKHYVKLFNKVKVTFSTLGRIASKCKYGEELYSFSGLLSSSHLDAHILHVSYSRNGEAIGKLPDY